MGVNVKRTQSFQKKTSGELQKIASSGSLGAAAAQHELIRRAGK